MKWDKAHEEEGKHTKLQRLWLGPFQIIEKIGPSTFLLQDLSGRIDSLLVNGKILKNTFPRKQPLLILYHIVFKILMKINVKVVFTFWLLKIKSLIIF